MTRPPSVFCAVVDGLIAGVFVGFLSYSCTAWLAMLLLSALSEPLLGPVGAGWLVLLMMPVPMTVFLLVTWGSYRRQVERYRASQGLCRACGYDLRASQGRCPECGREIAAASGK